MSEKKKVPIFLGEDDEQIQIGTAQLVPDLEWHDGQKFTHVLIDLDVFPGERATLARIVKWEEVVKHANSVHPRRSEMSKEKPTKEELDKLLKMMKGSPEAEKVRKDIEEILLEDEDDGEEEC